MIESPSYEEVRELLEQLADVLAVQMGSPSGGEAHWMEDRDIWVSEGATRMLAQRLAQDMPRARTEADRLHCIMMLTYEHEPLRISGAAPVQQRHAAATVAVYLTNTIARRYGLTLLGVTVEEYVLALTGGYMDHAQRFDAVRNLCRSGEQALVTADRPRPDPEDGPIVSVGTPISFVTKAQQLASLEVADQVEDVINNHGMQADVPGRHIHPGVNYPDADLMDRDRTARAALAVAVGFIGIDAHLSRRGMGFAVSQMESLGAPVLLMPKKIEAFVFARVFGSRLSHREEAIYDDPADAARHADAFLRDHEACMRERHADVINARGELRRVAGNLRRRLDAVDKTLFGQSRMSETRARYLVSDPAHLDSAHRWELLALSTMLDVPYELLAATVFRFDAGAARQPTLPTPLSVVRPTQGDGRGGRGSRSDARGFYRGGSQGGLSELEWEAFRAAPTLHPQWNHANGFILLDEYIQSVSPKQTAARGKRRTDARDWMAAYVERFGG